MYYWLFFFVFIKFLFGLRAKKKCFIICFPLPGDEWFFLSPRGIQPKAGNHTSECKLLS